MNLGEYISDSDALFHCTKMSAAIEYILQTKKLRASLLKNTNDSRKYINIQSSKKGVIAGDITPKTYHPL